MKRALTISTVYYESGDHLGHILAYFSLSPMLIVAAQFTLALTMPPSHSIAYTFLAVGQMMNEGMNLIFKQVLAIPRPDRAPSDGAFGMPSSHAQFIGFLWAAWPWFCHHGRLPGSMKNVDLWILMFVGGLLVMYSRWHLGYHTIDQIIIGFLIGYVLGTIWRMSSQQFIMKFE